MRIKKLLLQNIRSYDIAEIEFPKGNVLLSGDIGAGKSTVLLAVEFALFGLQRGTGGNILLRNGKAIGGVKLDLEIDGKEVRIERKLKRTNDTIKQDACYIEYDGTKEQLSSTELKSKVLSLLSYPQEFLSKNPLIYRYTVYTPQEEMKSILTEDASLRLDTLRKVFGIDKYQRIISNSEILSADIREKIKEREGRVADLESKKDESKAKKEELLKVHAEITKLRYNFEKVSAVFNEKKKIVDEFEGKIKDASKLKAELAGIASEFRLKREQLENNEDNVSEVAQKTKVLEEKISQKSSDPAEIDKVASKLKVKETELNDADKKYLDLTRLIAGDESNKARLQKIAREITSLDNCPTCRQKVGVEHKHDINDKNEKEIAEIDNRLTKFKSSRDDIEKKKREIIKEINDLRIKDKSLSLLKVELKSLEDSKATLKKFDDLVKTISERLKVLGVKKIELEGNVASFKDLDEKYNLSRRELEKSRDEQKQVEISKARSERQLEDLTAYLEKVDKEIADKEKVKLSISKLKRFKDWLNSSFPNTIQEMEKAIMNKVHAEFSMLFGKWFAMLSNGLSARINEDFTPIIEQQGYEIEYGHLSGGERTAAALAYRLALNQVINSIMSTIKTKDLLILDEPTDGFSYEQLDKMRDVLHELKLGQLILVSHETKIESFVDNIIRFDKQEGITSVGQHT